MDIESELSELKIMVSDIHRLLGLSGKKSLGNREIESIAKNAVLQFRKRNNTNFFTLKKLTNINQQLTYKNIFSST